MSVPPHSGPRPTLEDVAARAGVSRATASRVLNSSPRVSRAAHDAVTAAVAELGYQPNRAARTLVTRRTDAVAVVFSESEPTDDHRLAWLIRATAAALADADVQMVLLLVRTSEDLARAERVLTGGHVDGALVFAPRKGDRLVPMARRLALPVVFAGRPWGPTRGLHVVDHDHEGGGALAAEHLVASGRTRIVAVGGPRDVHPAADRLAGARDVLDACPVEDGGSTRDGARRAMAELLRRVPDLDGVFAVSDHLASGVLDALREAGRRVPEDVAVVGFDDDPTVAPHTVPPLTSVRQDVEAQVAGMVTQVLRLLRDDPVRPRREILPTTLVRRGTT
ncbi:LacI family DNA-binding transcriptional regulator [Saccharothrix violaceirubra]|uniref:DNA-binding LacI/PurR family transcriptional regulator n=1 Tax=Saccharothrix violaceirubra TaxID=413306 RepID=A0A7W7WV60_9PSEU|nr:LacI family DNA-binding transcriptional regulator [Saccharothrix violaceirubra]MBB4964203.1 DNA-binding LacI/PurR family transcriptional regulator [Saccharothrix violaceirubra]